MSDCPVCHILGCNIDNLKRRHEEEEGRLYERLKEYRQGDPSDIRKRGWAVAVHNDYAQDGQNCTFWLFTKGDRAVKGEGQTDAEALNEIRKKIGQMEEG